MSRVALLFIVSLLIVGMPLLAFGDLPSLMPDRVAGYRTITAPNQLDDSQTMGATLSEIGSQKLRLRMNLGGVDYQFNTRSMKTQWDYGDVSIKSQWRYSGDRELEFGLPLRARGWKLKMSNKDGSDAYQLQYAVNF